MTLPTPRRILLQGYYGYANLGDDLLLLVAYRMLRETFPQASIHVRCLSSRGSYLRVLLGEHVPLVSALEPTNFDLIVAGGGGVFFDFDESSPVQRWVNRVASTLPAPWLAAARRGYRKLKGTLGADAPRKVGIGIGVGTFTDSSAKFVQAKATLGEFSWLMVRDPASRENALRIAPSLDVRLGADLVFARRYWCPPSLLSSEICEPPRGVTFVLRGWKYDRMEHLSSVATAVEQLRREKVAVSLVLFDPADEQVVLPSFPRVPALIWRPGQIDLGELLEHLRRSELVVTTRAHGAIASGCLGVPSICLAIEPKLRIVAEMFPRSGLSLDLGEGLAERLFVAICGRLSEAQHLRPLVTSDVEDQERMAQEVPSLLRNASSWDAAAS
ncbi:MAG: polysaccharide pyruvyl transferase family protein [Myxococcales bacterium]|nr:polysaccharide pyruvyl transferase family protein [Polyangiaceae bacterium]MDW8250490.1 polysaccharide pyruvyl transferase family protein [Myxococcales bacterium]